MDLLHIALLKPEIHPNTGNIARLCVANQLPLHIVGRPGFRIDEKSIRRAGLDYWPYVDLRQDTNLEALKETLTESRFFYFSSKAKRSYLDVKYQRGDCLIFGPESRGLPEEVLRANSKSILRIPMLSSNVRSLNLASAVAIAVYEALRQILGRNYLL